MGCKILDPKYNPLNKCVKEKIEEKVIKDITIILTSLVVISHDKNVFGVGLGELVELKIGNIV
jgi:hypothetical protein